MRGLTFAAVLTLLIGLRRISTETGECYDDSDCNMYDSNSVCHIPYAGCPEGSCQCGAGYYEDLGECYEVREIGEFCEVDEDCEASTVGSYCGPDFICTCDHGYPYMDEDGMSYCYELQAWGDCHTSQQCLTYILNNDAGRCIFEAELNFTVCGCSQHYNLYLQECIPALYGETCSIPNSEVEKICTSNMICTSDGDRKICDCGTDMVWDEYLELCVHQLAMRNLDLGEECNLSFNTEDGLLCYDWLTCASCWEDSTAQMVCLLEQEVHPPTPIYGTSVSTPDATTQANSEETTPSTHEPQDLRLFIILIAVFGAFAFVATISVISLCVVIYLRRRARRESTSSGAGDVQVPSIQHTNNIMQHKVGDQQPQYDNNNIYTINSSGRLQVPTVLINPGGSLRSTDSNVFLDAAAVPPPVSPRPQSTATSDLQTTQVVLPGDVINRQESGEYDDIYEDISDDTKDDSSIKDVSEDVEHTYLEVVE